VVNPRNRSAGDKMALDEIFINLKTDYNSNSDSIVEDLYKPCLDHSSLYYRGAAYFRSAVFQLFKQEILNFCLRGGKIAILTSTNVESNDAENILQGYHLRAFESNLEEMMQDKETVDKARFVSTLIASGHLDIYIVKGGFYHDKKGFFEDENDNIVAFAGSGNETISGLSINYESYIVSWSEKDSFADYGRKWSDELKLAIDEKEYEDAEVLRFDQLSEYFIQKYDIVDSLEKYDFPVPHQFNYFNYQMLSENGPQEHQFNAFNGWKANEGHGLFEHATGTYKTATGLICADYFLGSDEVVIVSTPLKMISENWYQLIKKCFSFKIKVVRCWSDNGDWMEEAGKHINNYQKVILVFVNDSLWSEKGTNLLKPLNNQYMLIADEAHNWEDKRSREFMKFNFPISKLALTAKLSEPGNEAEIDDVYQFFAKEYTDHLSLEHAIEKRFLRKYEYHLEVIKLSQDLVTLASENTRSIWNSFSDKKRHLTPEITVDALSINRRVLVYTGPTIMIAEETYQSIQNQWNVKTNSAGLIRKITGEESAIQRKNIISDFILGNIRSLVAIKVLDEGVDLPVSDAAIMCLSNEKFRQWTQRRGRILRKKNMNDETTARIIDFVLDISHFDETIQNNLKNSHSSEVKRIIAFSSSSIHGSKPSIATLEQLGWI
jgi:superfamily II DNA or RNA helicase